MTDFKAVREFALNNPPESKIGFDHNGTWIVNPWYDPSYRYYLTGEEAVAEYGFENVHQFVLMADEEIKRREHISKKKFIVDIEETLVSGFEVWAVDMDEAMEIAEEKYHSGEFVLGGDADVAFRQMRASTADFEETTEWTEF